MRNFAGVVELAALTLLVTGCALAPPRVKPLDFALSEPGVVAPDGQALFLTGAGHIWKIVTPLGAAAQMTSGIETERILDITTDGKYLLFERRSSEADVAGLYFMPSAGGEPVRILHDAKIKVSYAASAADGRRVFFLANDREPKSFALYQFDLESRRKELLFSERGGWFVADVMNDTRFLLGKSKGTRGNEYYDWNLTTGELLPVVGQGTSEEYEVRFGREAGEYLVLSAAGGETRKLFRLRAGKFEQLPTADVGDLQLLQTDLRHFRYYVSWLDAGRTRWEVRDGTSLETVNAQNFPFADAVRIGRPTRFGRYVGILIEDAAPAGQTHFIYDWKTATLSEWTRRSF